MDNGIGEKFARVFRKLRVVGADIDNCFDVQAADA
jgi:hypothetical protein